MAMASGPLSLMMAMAPVPGAVEGAHIVDSSFKDVFYKDTKNDHGQGMIEYATSLKGKQERTMLLAQNL